MVAPPQTLAITTGSVLLAVTTSGPTSQFRASRQAHAVSRRTWWIAGLFGLATLAIYANALRAPFMFDDIPSIPENPSLRQLWPPHIPLSPPGEGLTVSGRPLLNLSFALNEAIAPGPAGFRAANLAIHLCSALLLFGLARRTLRRCGPQTVAFSAGWAGATIGGLWLLHPLQTAAVTYIVQRAESLTACFYLLTLYAFARHTDSPRPARWLALSACSCLLGMATKEVMVSAPLAVVLYDRLFVAQTAGEMWRRRKGYYAALAATWILLLVLLAMTGGRGGTAGFSLGVGWLQYWSTQFRAIVRYLGLAIWPHPLVLDHGVEWERSLADVIPYAVAVVALGGATLLALHRGKRIAWLGVVFLAVLAPTSLMPGGRQTMAEHRMYLPLAAVLVILILGLARLVGRRAVLVTAATAAALGTLTIQRNADYRSTLAIWNDTVAKCPDNRWARDNLGNALMELDRPSDALVQYEAALALDPTDAVHHLNTGFALARLGRPAESLERFREAARLAPDYPKARIALADAFFRAGRMGDAIAEFQRAAALRPQDIACSYALGSLLLQAGRPSEAVTELKRTLALAPDHAEAAANLGGALAQLGRLDDALTALREAQRLNPANPEPHNNLGVIYLHLGRHDEAAREFAETLRLNPDHAMARQNLARLQAQRRMP